VLVTEDNGTPGVPFSGDAAASLIGALAAYVILAIIGLFLLAIVLWVIGATIMRMVEGED
jgi:hypothetical protein